MRKKNGLTTEYFRNYYYEDLIDFYKYNIQDNSTVLEIGCKDGKILSGLNLSKGVGVDKQEWKPNMSINGIKYKYTDLESFTINEKFDYVIMSDTLFLVSDIQKVFHNIKESFTKDTRLIITYYNDLYSYVLKIAEKLGLKHSHQRLNWLSKNEINNLLYLEGFQVIKSGSRFIFPIKIYGISKLLNKYLSKIPLLESLCFTKYIIARCVDVEVNTNPSLSIIIPARNEKGNIENAIKRIYKFNNYYEIIFVEGNSTDGTFEEIERVRKKYSDINIISTKQPGVGKADAVRKGFSVAKGDVLMILDADLTVPPEELRKFYDAIAKNKGDFINGSRLMYPMQEQAMQFLNKWGNRFFSYAFSWILDQKLTDTLCGTKVLSKKHYNLIKANRNYFGDFDPFGDFDLLFGASKLNLKIVEVPVHYKAREYGSTNISRFKHGFLLLKMVLFSLNKIKFI